MTGQEMGIRVALRKGAGLICGSPAKKVDPPTYLENMIMNFVTYNLFPALPLTLVCLCSTNMTLRYPEPVTSTLHAELPELVLEAT